MLKLQPIDKETAALRTCDDHGAARLLRHDPDSGAMLLERLDADCTLAAVPDDLAALRILSELLARLTAVAAAPGLRRLADIAAAMLDRVPRALAAAAHGRTPTDPHPRGRGDGTAPRGR